MWFAIGGAAALVLYSIPTQANFGRVDATYSGILTVLSLLRGWHIDKIAPKRFDVIGGAVTRVHGYTRF